MFAHRQLLARDLCGAAPAWRGAGCHARPAGRPAIRRKTFMRLLDIDLRPGSRGQTAVAVQACRASLICSYSSRRRTSSARGSSALFAVGRLLGRQQHARLDFDQHGRHQQVFWQPAPGCGCGSRRRRLVLARDIRHRDVRMLKFCLRIRYSSRSSGPQRPPENLQRIGRDVQVWGAGRTAARRTGVPGHPGHHLGNPFQPCGDHPDGLPVGGEGTYRCYKNSSYIAQQLRG